MTLKTRRDIRQKFFYIYFNIQLIFSFSQAYPYNGK